MERELEHLPAPEPPAESQWHARDASAVLDHFGVATGGLTATEAARRLGEVGPNELRREETISPLAIFFRQFQQFLVLLLLAATAVSLLLGEMLDAAVIFAIVVLSASLGFLQEYRASRALNALRRLAAPEANVVRGGEESRVLAREVVPGDILVLAAGDRVPADGRVIEQYNLKVDESVLTGESEPTRKLVEALPVDTSLGDRKNLVFGGTTVMHGRGVAVVVGTGMQTEFGRIAHLVHSAGAYGEKTPLEAKTEAIGRTLGVAAVAAVVVVVSLGLLRGNGLLPMFFWGVSLAVAAVPEALPAVVTGALTLGVQRMARHNAIVRRLPAVETLGATTMICTDKTGTLTMNQMTVRRLWVGRHQYRLSGTGYEPTGELLDDAGAVPPDGDVQRLIRSAVLCNDASLVRDEYGRHGITGDPTEAALLVVAAKMALPPEPMRIAYPRVAEVSFSSVRKRMSTVHAAPLGKGLVCMKGAPEALLPSCRFYLRDGRPEPLTDRARSEILAAAEGMAAQTLRVLAVAERDLPRPPAEMSEQEIERDLVFVGLAGMVDPPREEVKEALRLSEQAGVRTVMITGDHLATAAAIARELGLLRPGNRCLTGAELDRLGKADFEREVEGISVYARVSPEHKLRIVGALQDRGHVVAMTGDGLNDAPALRRADIGVAMGIAGTDVTREAADMVLSDDNFATIVRAMAEGRAIYDNVKKYLAYLLSSNTGEIFVMFVAGVVGLPLPLLPVQILWVNLVTDGLPAIALGVDPPDPDVMQRPPRPPDEGVFTRGVLMLIGGVGGAAGLVVLGAFVWQLQTGAGLLAAQTMAFTVLVVFEMFNAFNARSEHHSIFRVGPLRNRWLLVAVLSSIMLQLAVLYIPPLQGVFGVQPPSPQDWLAIVLLGSSALAIGEVGKQVLYSQPFRR